MDVMLKRHCAKHIYRVPEGLRELMTDISREVLRMQPVDTYTFIADYLDALIITRENARVAARVVESLIHITITTAALLEATGSTREEVDKIVSIIRKSFNKSLEDTAERIPSVSEEVEEANIVSDILNEAHVSSSRAEVCANVIQNAYRQFKERKERERELLKDVIDWRIAARSAIYLYRRTGVTNEEAHHAATLIKAAYKGYYTRKILKQMAPDAALQQAYLERYSDERFDIDGSHKSVRINYDTVIPHVDFDDSRKVIGGEDPLTAEDSRNIEDKLQREMGISICKSVISDIVTNAVEILMRAEGFVADSDFNLREEVLKQETYTDEHYLDTIDEALEEQQAIDSENAEPVEVIGEPGEEIEQYIEVTEDAPAATEEPPTEPEERPVEKGEPTAAPDELPAEASAEVPEATAETNEPTEAAPVEE